VTGSLATASHRDREIALIPVPNAGGILLQSFHRVAFFCFPLNALLHRC
jgi:hypothetical protein